MKTHHTFARIVGVSLVSTAAALLLSACGSESGATAPSATSATAESSGLTGGVPDSSRPGPRPKPLTPVNLGSAGSFAILSKSGITDVYPSSIVGDVGSSPITGAAILVSCGEVSGRIYSVDAAGPLPCRLTNATLLGSAVGAMGTAYNDAAGRLNPNFVELGAGEIGGRTLVPGLYKWGTSVSITTDVTLSGNSDAVWIFQVAGQLNQGNGTRVTLAGGARAKNIFWQVARGVSIGTTAHFEGVVLGKTLIAVKTGASVNGRLLAQTAVTLQMNSVTQPAR